MGFSIPQTHYVHGENTNLALVRPLQEFAQWPSANGRCTSTSFVSVVGSLVFCSWNQSFFCFCTAVHVLNSLQSRLPPIDVDSEQADLPEVLVAIQRLGSCKVSGRSLSWTRMQHDSPHMIHASVDIHNASRLSRDWSSCEHCNYTYGKASRKWFTCHLWMKQGDWTADHG